MRVCDYTYLSISKRVINSNTVSDHQDNRGRVSTKHLNLRLDLKRWRGGNPFDYMYKMGTISLYIIVTWLYNVASIATWVYYNCNCVCTFCSPGARKVAPAGTKSLARKLTAVWIVPLCVCGVGGWG